MRPIRDFRPQQLYGVTQRGNQGQWVYRDPQDFRKALDLMERYAARYGVNIHGWCFGGTRVEARVTVGALPSQDRLLGRTRHPCRHERRFPLAQMRSRAGSRSADT